MHPDLYVLFSIPFSQCTVITLSVWAEEPWVSTHTDRHKHTGTSTHMHTDTHTDRRAQAHTDTQTGTSTHWHTDRHKHTHAHTRAHTIVWTRMWKQRDQRTPLSFPSSSHWLEIKPSYSTSCPLIFLLSHLQVSICFTFWGWWLLRK